MTRRGAAHPKSQPARKRARRVPASAMAQAAPAGLTPAPDPETASPFGATDRARGGPSSIEQIGERETGSIEAVAGEALRTRVPGFVEPAPGDEAAPSSRGD